MKKAKGNPPAGGQKAKGCERGVTLYLAMLIMSAALATALFIASVFVREFRIAKEVADSARAVYVADSAMEYTLYEARVVKSFNSSPFIALGADYVLPTNTCATTVFVTAANAACSITANVTVPLGSLAGCPAAPNCTAADCTHITTKGAYGTTNRAIEIVYPNC